MTLLCNAKGGQNKQSDAGAEANLDVQFALGISFPTPGTFYSTGGQPPFKLDEHAVANTNEPYMTVSMCALLHLRIP